MHIRLNRRDCSSLAPLRSFLHQRSNRVRALIWGGAISAADVTPFPGQSSFERRGCVLYPSRDGAIGRRPASRRFSHSLATKRHELPSSACFSFLSLLFFPFASSYTNNSIRVPFSLRFFFSLPSLQTPEYTLFLFLSVSFVSFIIILVTSSSLSSSDNYIPPSLSISRLAHDTRLGSLPTLSLTREFPSCNIVYIIERIDEYAYLSHLICAQGRSRLPPSNLFSPFFFFCHSQSTQIISLDPRSK